MVPLRAIIHEKIKMIIYKYYTHSQSHIIAESPNLKHIVNYIQE
jgi:hypothetical protein